MSEEERVRLSGANAPPSVLRLNLRIAELVKDLDPQDLVEVLSGRASWLLHEDQNQNQNQGSRAELA
jgi:hypothetical protein